MSEPDRPNPDEILARLKRDETAAARGKLKIFFGMSPGVGKTFAMLQAAQQKVAARQRGRHRHCRDTRTKRNGSADSKACRSCRGRSSNTAARSWRRWISTPFSPGIRGLAVVDELAHTNAPGSRHPKRYQDVLELLDAGIDVYTTLNVQHVASRSDTVRQISGVTVSETVPDSVLDLADEMVLIDLTPEQLRARLAEGKVYLGERAEWAAQEFLPRKQSHRLARNGPASRGRTCRSRFARHHVRAKNRRPVEKRRPVARRGQRESVFGTVDSLHAPARRVDGSIMDRREHRESPRAFARRSKPG